MSQIFGEFIQKFPLDNDSLELSFTTSSKPIETRWENHRLSANFMAEYFSNILPIDAEDEVWEERINAMKNAVSYVGNELLENAMKFNECNQYKVKFGIHFMEDLEKVKAVIFAQNSINTETAGKFQAFIKELLCAEDTVELYDRQIEKTAEDEDSEASGLGLLSAINDYSAKLGWKFEIDPSEPHIVIVTTMAKIVV